MGELSESQIKNVKHKNNLIASGIENKKERKSVKKSL